MRKKASSSKKRITRLKSSKILIIIFGILFAVFIPTLLGMFSLNGPNAACANSISCIQDLSGAFDPTQTEGTFMGQKVSAALPFALLDSQKKVLGDSTEEKIIKIDLTNQKLYAYEGAKKIYEFLVSTGKWGQTPTGEFNVWVKLRATRMTGGNKEWGTFYDLPNVQYTMFFSNDKIPKTRGFGIHGAYWHNNFGHPMSHGCINMKTEEAALLYAWASPDTQGYTTYSAKDTPGTKIVIYGEAPNE